jgi:hypothetical protein
MPLIKKVIDYGKTSKGVILPKSWLELIERHTGKPVKEVTMEVNGQLTIKPILDDITSVNQSNN